METDTVVPQRHVITRNIRDDQGESMIYLLVDRYTNAIHAALYDKEPRLGSMTLAYPVADRMDRHTVFAGKNEELSSALGLILGRAVGTMVYASVNVGEYATVTTTLLKEMISEYLEEIEEDS